MLEYYMFNKPRGCITARRDARHKTIMDYFPNEKRNILFPVGRLDKDTEGLLIVTNDGQLSFNLMMPEKEVAKTYFFWALGILSEDSVREIEAGISIYSGSEAKTKPSKIIIHRVSTLKSIEHLLGRDDIKLCNRKGGYPVTSGYITITEGKKHQVKRMVGYSGCRVVYLKRLKIGNLELDCSLAPGDHRALTCGELLELRGIDKLK